MYRLRPDKEFDYGYNSITTIDEVVKNTMMDFGILKMRVNQIETDNESKERAYLLIEGEARLEWEDNNVVIKRNSCFDEDPWVLHLPKAVELKITALTDNTEFAVTKTYNNNLFDSKLYTPQECRSE